MGNDLVLTAYGPQPLSRMVRFYRSFGRIPDVGCGTPNRVLYREALRAIIRTYRQNGPVGARA